MGGNIAWGSSARGSEAVALMKDKRRTCLLDLVLLMAARGHFPSPIFPSRPSTYPLAAVMLRDGGAGTQEKDTVGADVWRFAAHSSHRGGGCFLLFVLSHHFFLRPVSPSTTHQDLLLHMPTMAARRCMVSAIGDLISSRVNRIFRWASRQHWKAFGLIGPGGGKGRSCVRSFFLEGRHDDDGMLGYSGGSKAEG